MKLNKILVNSIVATVLSLNLQAKVTMPAIFTDGMVLQQQNLVAIWGSSDRKQQRITVKPSWSNKEYTTVSDDLGRWKMKLETNRKVWNSEKIKRILK